MKTRKIHHKKRTSRKAGMQKTSEEITIHFDNILNGNEDTRQLPVSITCNVDTLLKDVVSIVSQQGPYPVDATSLFLKKKVKHIPDINKPVSALHLKNNDVIYYVRKHLELTYPIVRAKFKKSCSTSLGLIFYTKLTYIFNDGSQVNGYLGYGLQKIRQSMMSSTQESFHHLFPQPHIIIFTEEDLEHAHANICDHPLLQSFKINQLFKTFSGAEIEQRKANNEQYPPTYLLRNRAGPPEFHVVSNTRTDVEPQLNELIEYENEKYLKSKSMFDSSIYSEFSEDMDHCFGFRHNSVHKKKVDLILNF